MFTGLLFFLGGVKGGFVLVAHSQRLLLDHIQFTEYK